MIGSRGNTTVGLGLVIRLLANWLELDSWDTRIFRKCSLGTEKWWFFRYLFTKENIEPAHADFDETLRICRIVKNI